MADTTRKKAGARKALAIGRSMATDVLALRDAALRRRAAAIRRRATKAAVRKRVVSPQRLAAVGGSARTGVLVAEGDSWFDYPWHDVLQMLDDRHGYDVESVAHKGDRVESMAYSGQLLAFASLIEKLVRQGSVPDAILLSGGGNDVAGDEFAMLLDHAASPRPGLNDQVVSGVIDQRVRDAFVAILAAVTKVSRARTGSVIPIIVHGYDHPVPDGRGVLGGWGPLPGPWLRPGFHDKGFSDPQECIDMAAELIDRFNLMLQRVAGMPEFEHVRYLDLRGTLSNGSNYKTWWANELHPTERGFAAVADRFAAVI
jgi:lysophospholipase L1-like esterase